MSIRSQDLDTNALLLYPLGKGAGSIHEAAPVYSLPQDEEDSEGGQGSALREGEEEGADLKLALLVDTKGKLSNDTVETDVKETSAASGDPVVDPTLLPAGYGAAIVTAFLAMIKYLNEMSQQGYQTTVYSANAMIGTNGSKGLIQSWVDAGMNSANAAGDQAMDEAIGSLVSAGVCGISFFGSVGGAAKNSTSGVGEGMFQTETGKINAELKDANSYKDMLNEATTGDFVAESESQKIPEQAAQNANQAARENQLAEQSQEKMTERKPEMDPESLKLKKIMKEKAEQLGYKAKKDGKLSEADKEYNEKIKENNDKIEDAAKHLQTADEKTAAKKKADEWIESLQKQLENKENSQQKLVNILNSFSNMGQSGGQSYGKWTGSQAQVEAGQQKANSDVFAQTSQTTEGVKEKATQKAQADQEAMRQEAGALAQALASQTQSRA
jgi:hypothetical protein